MTALESQTRAWARRKVSETIGVYDVARQLARIPRWLGRTEPAPFSVAQHSCIVADAVMRATRNALAACYALMHDGHEIVTGDVPADLKELLALLLKGSDVLPLLQDALDLHIFTGVGLDWPMPDDIAAAVKVADARARATEIRDLCVRGVATKADPLPNAIHTIWPWSKAEDNFVKTWNGYADLAGLPPARRA